MFSPPSRRRPSARTRAGLRAHSRRLTGADDDGNGGDGGSGAEEGGYLSPESQESTDEDDSASDASSCSSDKPPRWVASARPSEETEQILDSLIETELFGESSWTLNGPRNLFCCDRGLQRHFEDFHSFALVPSEVVLFAMIRELVAAAQEEVGDLNKLKAAGVQHIYPAYRRCQFERKVLVELVKPESGVDEVQYDVVALVPLLFGTKRDPSMYLDLDVPIPGSNERTTKQYFPQPNGNLLDDAGNILSPFPHDHERPRYNPIYPLSFVLNACGKLLYHEKLNGNGCWSRFSPRVQRLVVLTWLCTHLVFSTPQHVVAEMALTPFKPEDPESMRALCEQLGCPDLADAFSPPQSQPSTPSTHQHDGRLDSFADPPVADRAPSAFPPAPPQPSLAAASPTTPSLDPDDLSVLAEKHEERKAATIQRGSGEPSWTLEELSGFGWREKAEILLKTLFASAAPVQYYQNSPESLSHDSASSQPTLLTALTALNLSQLSPEPTAKERAALAA
ncbi:hypothetical protein JCM10213v2_007719 [Rhodosporidiobolus nylandii]